MPEPSSLEGLLADRRAAARGELGATMRALADDGQQPEGLLSAVAADAFFEPRLYTQLIQSTESSAEMSLEQLLFAGRGARDVSATARTDAQGFLCLPGLGRCRTPYRDAVVTFRLDEGAGTASVRHHDVNPVVPEWQPCSFIPGTAIELIGYADQVLAAFLATHIDNPEQLSVVPDPAVYGDLINEALGLIAAVRPAFHSWLTESLRGVFLYQHPTAESFAALGLHGIIFLNVPDAPGLDYFVEELAHQGGHVVFSEATLSRTDFFQGDPDQELSDFTGEPDGRTVYDTLHGLYTEHMESQVVMAILQGGHNLTEQDEADFERHLRAVMSRHTRDVELVGRFAGAMFAEPGRAVFDMIEQAHRAAARTLLALAGQGDTEPGSGLERSQ